MGAADHVKISATDGAGCESDNRVIRLFDLRLFNVFEANITDPVEYNCFHKTLSSRN